MRERTASGSKLTIAQSAGDKGHEHSADHLDIRPEIRR